MVTIEIYEDISGDLARRIGEELSAAGGSDVTLRVCSGGGSVFAGQAIVARLVDYPGRVVAVVDGLAASAASFVAVGGSDELIMSKGSELMIHAARMDMLLGGTSDEYRTAADDLDRWTAAIAEVYARKSGEPVEHWLELMQRDTWFTAEEAVAAGLADSVRETPVPAAASGVMESAVARYDYLGRHVPAPLNNREKGRMSWTDLADELGVTAEQLKAVILEQVKNETVAITGEVEVTYPEGRTIVPTERITVEPIVGEAEGEPQNSGATGLIFAMGTVPEGFTAEVGEQTGIVTITAPAGAEPGDNAEFTVAVNDVEVPLTVTVRALSEETDTPEEPAHEEPLPHEGTVSLDRETYNILKNHAKAGLELLEREQRKERAAEVDEWVRTGRIAAAIRDKALAVMERDPDLARDVYGANPVGTIPTAEVGHAGDDGAQSKAEKLLAKARAMKSNNSKGEKNV